MNTAQEDKREQLEKTIANLEAQRAVLGSDTVNAAVAALRRELLSLTPSPEASVTSLQGERKLVTIMFADISGFTSLAETLDPETVHNMISACFEQLVPIIERHEGTVDKFIGDAIMALFGAPIAHENDPEQALHAAIEMIQALAALNAAWGTDLGLHIGINTGMVYAGGVGTHEQQSYSVIGDAVNLASRLEKTAARDEILVGPDTHRLTVPLFEFEALEPIEIKGKSQQIRIHRLKRARPRTFRVTTRGIKDIETHMIGRDAELSALKRVFHQARDGRRQLVTVVGEAGVGKSRLLYEFETWVEQLPGGIHVFKGRASPEMQNAPYALIRNLFSFSLQIQDSDPANTMREKIEQAVTKAFERSPGIRSHPQTLSRHLDKSSRAHMRAHFIGQLLGFDFSHSPYLQGALDDAQQIRNRAMNYMGEFFQATAAHAPTAILLEDIHWADDSSLEALELLARATAKQRLLFVCLARPSLFEHHPHWGEELKASTQLALQPLSQADSLRLVDEVLQKVKRIPPTLRELVANGAEGNPFYVEELVKMLIQDGVIVKEQDRWRVELARLTTVRVPPTLTGVIQARLDSLPREERTILQQASVVGRIFWDSAVDKINRSAQDKVPAARIHSEQSGTTPVQSLLSALGNREMVFRCGTSSFAETQEYIFKHAILREVTYESVLRRVRRLYHALVAEWLIEHSGERAGEVVGLIADHLELAEQTGQALDYLRRAGEQAAAQFANNEAVNYFSRALALVPQADLAARYTLLLARERIYDLQGAREAQLQDIIDLKDLARQLREPSRQAEANLRQANYARVTGDYPGAIAAAREAVELAASGQDIRTEAAGYLQWGLTLWRMGTFAACRSRLERGLALSRAAGDRQVEADSLRILGNVCYYQSDYNQATAYWEQALSISREIGDRVGEASAHSNIGEAARSQGDYLRARTCYEQRLQICREIGERHGETIALLNVSLVSHNLGDDQAAREYILQALELARETGNRSHQTYALTNLGHALAGLGRLKEATDSYQQAVAMREQMGEQHLAMESRAGLARACLAQGDIPQAQDQVEEILRYLENNSLDGTEEPMRVYLTCYRVLQAGQDPRAREILSTAHATLQAWADKIPDEELQRSFLENVPAHREIVAAWER